jgi:hypothetical protein
MNDDVETEEFTDELSDEALDREGDACRGSICWVCCRGSN